MALLVLRSAPVANSVFRSLSASGITRQNCLVWGGRLYAGNVWQHTDACENLALS